MSDDKKKVAVKKTDDEQKGEIQRHSSKFEEMERMFDDIFQRRFFAPSWIPRLKFPEFADVATSVDMFEEGDNLVIKAEIPGMKKEDISIDFAGDVVSISGEKKTEEKTERKDFYRVERSFGSFSRKLRLPFEVQIENTKATFKEGVLEIRMPKSGKAKQSAHKIAVE